MAKEAAQGILTARPGGAGEAGEAGVFRLGLGRERDGLLLIPSLIPSTVPPGEGDGARPLMVLLHGAGGSAVNIAGLLDGPAAEAGCVLLAPESRKHTWDFLIDGFGPDVEFLDRALAQTFARCRIDAARVAIAGFSDGGSYALTLGLANGDLFPDVIAFSPGFMAPPRLAGSPRVFVSHGVHDRVLPIERCSRRVVPQMERLGLPVTYREFDGPHTVPEPIVKEAMAWFLRSALDLPGSR